ncbi:MAG: nitrilase-related carbon-nitrogen hydrolase, partial [Acidimicrobiales bacterium]
MSRLRVALCQMNPTVGDLGGNAERIIAAIGAADDAGCDLAVFGELAITGYPPEDLVLKTGFVADNLAAVAKVAAATERCAAVFGFIDQATDLFNAAAVCADGEVRGVYRKQELPNYSVFDELRYFTPGTGATQLWLIGGVRVGVSICEDAWNPAGPIVAQGAAGAELMININGSPYYSARLGERRQMLATRAADSSATLVYVNQVGGQDELVFDGGSLILDPDGHLLACLPQFTAAVVPVDIDVRPVYRKRLLDPRGRARAAPLPTVIVSEVGRQAPAADRLPMPMASPLGPEAEVYHALVTGTRDYVTKNG